MPKHSLSNEIGKRKYAKIKRLKLVTLFIFIWYILFNNLLGIISVSCCELGKMRNN